MPCYVGGYGQASDETPDSFGYPAQSAPYSGVTGASRDASQRSYYPGRNNTSQQDLGALQDYSSPDQGYYGTQNYNAPNYQRQQDSSSPYYQGQEAYSSSYDDGQQQGQYPTNQSQFDLSRNQPSPQASQIIQILLGAPDLLSSFKDVAGQQYGIDPATIPDSGVYNCIQQDPGFRSQVAAQLVQQGYTLNPVQRQPGAGRTNGAYPQSAPLSLSSRYPGYGPSRPPEQPSESRRLTPIPYANLPSLRDLYSQEVQPTGRLRRFGSDAFEFGSANMNLLPMDLPVGPDYVLGPGDNLVVNMWGGQSARLNRTIDRQGQIALPEAGTVVVSGITISQAQDAIQKALGTQFQSEHVELSLGRVRTIRIYVVGDVQRPGAYDVSSLSTAVNALYAAGGPTSRGSLRTLKQYRGNQLVQEIDLYDFLLHGVRSDVNRLLAGDTILVPPVGPQVSVTGMVRRSAIYELKDNENLSTVLNLAGGILVSADLKEIRIDRVMAHENHTMLRAQVADSASSAEMIPSFTVQDGDTVYVSPILPYNEKVVYLDGHVFKPGQYAWREGMTVSDLIHSYQDIMPEPADRAEVVRLVPPDLHPETIAFNLPDELVGNGPISLQPFDTVRVFGRYQIDPPRVSIRGAVLRPGNYPMSEGMTVSSLLQMAGGFRRSAYRDEADLTSYKIQNGQKVFVQHSVVDLSKALTGDKNANVTLQPGDVVGIRQLTGWQDIGASVSVNGEVAFAGTYGIQEGERLSSVLKRAGGFSKDAFPQGAVFERIQVRKMEENNREEMIRRVESTAPNVSVGAGSIQDQQSLLQTMRQQQQDILTSLRNHPSTGRMVIKISADMSKWENTPADVVMRGGDTLSVPKLPDFVLISGQVYNATGITFRPGKDARWYLRQAGGVTRAGDKGAIFIVRADGSVVGREKVSLLGESVLNSRMHPGDSIVVPDKVVGGSQVWRNLISAAQIMSSVALTGAVAGVF
ncbi:MAG: SLBB domain-containing protein [Terracidiphilus sp.]|jgi:protein involved in polysaccharide export with SLBB domain